MLKIFISFFVVINLSASSLDDALEEKINSNANSLSMQKKIDKLDSKTKELFLEYKKVSAKLENQKRYNKQLSNIVVSQEGEIKIVKNDISQIDNTSKNIYPLMENMIASLEKFIRIDTPFLLDERLSRVQRLKNDIKRADITLSNKYRAILESYMIENDYSNTIESYSAKLDDKVVDFFRLGRVALYYVSKDAKICGMYDTTQKKFISLDSKNIKHIKKAIKIAKKQLAPELLVMPIKKDI